MCVLDGLGVFVHVLRLLGWLRPRLRPRRPPHRDPSLSQLHVGHLQKQQEYEWQDGAHHGTHFR